MDINKHSRLFPAKTPLNLAQRTQMNELGSQFLENEEENKGLEGWNCTIDHRDLDQTRPHIKTATTSDLFKSPKVLFQPSDCLPSHHSIRDYGPHSITMLGQVASEGKYA